MPREGETGARLASSGYELVFAWSGDRFEHTVSSGAASSPTAPRIALDSTTHPDFETPVYQEVHQQGDLVFASGMSGDRHWSASIEATEDGFLFDVACRYKKPASAIGSAYKRSGTPALHVIGKPIDDSRPPQLTTVETTISIESRPTRSGDTPTTCRFRYAIAKEGSHWI